MVSDVHIALQRQSGKQMNHTEQHGIKKHSHRLIQRYKPQSRNGNLMSKECLRYNIQCISKITAEQHAPEQCGKSTPEEQLNGFPQVCLHTREFQKYNTAGQGYNQSVCRVGQHKSKQKHIKNRCKEGRINFSFCRQSKRCQNTFHRFREPVIVKKYRRLFFLLDSFCLCRCTVVLRQFFYNGVCLCGRNITTDGECTRCLRDLSQNPIFFCSCPIIIGDELQILTADGAFCQFAFQLLCLLLCFRNLCFQILFILFRNLLHR